MIRHRIRRFLGIPTAIAIGLAFHPSATAATVEGFTEPFRDIQISAPGEPGRITRIHVREGQTVRRGQVLIELDTRVLDASLQIAESRWTMNGRAEAARAEVELRSDRWKRLQELGRDGHASSAELRRASTDLRVSKANYQLAEEEKTLAKLECDRIRAQIDRRKLKSPIDGVVVDILREEGESTGVGKSDLLRLVRLDKLRVQMPVSVRHAATVSAGRKVTLRLPEVSQSATAIVELVSPVLDARSGTVEVTLVIDNAKGEYRSGLRCVMEVEGPEDDPLNFDAGHVDLSLRP